jgi:hypothetical protein
MERYIHEQNLIHYRKVLAETTDQTKRDTVFRLLAHEEASVLTANGGEVFTVAKNQETNQLQAMNNNPRLHGTIYGTRCLHAGESSFSRSL